MKLSWAGVALGLIFTHFTSEVGLAEVRPTQAKQPLYACKTAPKDASTKVVECHLVENVLPNASVAYTVGIAILKEHWGPDIVRRHRYEVIESHRELEWCFVRKWPKGVDIPTGGGHPELCLSKRTGEVTRMIDSR